MVSPKNPSDPVYSTRNQHFCQGDYRLPSSFKYILKQEGSTSLATRHVQIPGKIITELSVSVRRLDHQETGGDLEGTRVPPG